MYIRYGCRDRDSRANSVNSQSPKSRFLLERLTLLVRLLLRLQLQACFKCCLNLVFVYVLVYVRSLSELLLPV